MNMDYEEILEQFEEVQYRMENEGFDYCFESYSSFNEIQDEGFHELRLNYLKSKKLFEDYINNKVDDLRDLI